ncbi:MAG TPA: class F sortase [Micromonosporaceae bacterium]
MPKGPIAVVLVLAGVFATGAGLGRTSGDSWSGWLASRNERPAARATPPARPSQPVRITIESIGVVAPVHPVGLAPDGSIAVPDVHRHNETGWYDGGPVPGETGPAIIVGHVDTRTGPSVFYRLRSVQPGSRVVVTRADSSEVTFEITSVEYFDKGNLPVERVYGDYSRPGLRLITCGGRWLGGSIGYSDNVVAFASLVGAAP